MSTYLGSEIEPSLEPPESGEPTPRSSRKWPIVIGTLVAAVALIAMVVTIPLSRGQEVVEEQPSVLTQSEGTKDAAERVELEVAEARLREFYAKLDVMFENTRGAQGWVTDYAHGREVHFLAASMAAYAEQNVTFDGPIVLRDLVATKVSLSKDPPRIRMTVCLDVSNSQELRNGQPYVEPNGDYSPREVVVVMEKLAGIWSVERSFAMQRQPC